MHLLARPGFKSSRPNALQEKVSKGGLVPLGICSMRATDYLEVKVSCSKLIMGLRVQNTFCRTFKPNGALSSPSRRVVVTRTRRLSVHRSWPASALHCRLPPTTNATSPLTGRPQKHDKRNAGSGSGASGLYILHHPHWVRKLPRWGLRSHAKCAMGDNNGDGNVD